MTTFLPSGEPYPRRAASAGTRSPIAVATAGPGSLINRDPQTHPASPAGGQGKDGPAPSAQNAESPLAPSVTAAARRRRNSGMPSKPANPFWTGPGLRRLASLAAQGRNASEIAAALGRTADAVRCAAHRHKIVLGQRPACKAERNQQIVALHQSGMTLKALAVRFGITRQRVSSIIDKATRSQPAGPFPFTDSSGRAGAFPGAPTPASPGRPFEASA